MSLIETFPDADELKFVADAGTSRCGWESWLLCGQGLRVGGLVSWGRKVICPYWSYMVSPCSLLVVRRQCPAPRARVRSTVRVFLHRALGCVCARKVARHIQPLGNQCFSQPLQVHCLNQEGVPPVFTAFAQFVVAVRASRRARCLLTLVNLLALRLVVLVVGLCCL